MAFIVRGWDQNDGNSGWTPIEVTGAGPNGNAKTPIEFLYLDAAAIPIQMIIASRRLMYHQTILKRVDKELTKRIYKEQTIHPTPGDFVKLLEEDFKIIEEKQN